MIFAWVGRCTQPGITARNYRNRWAPGERWNPLLPTVLNFIGRDVGRAGDDDGILMML
jgi:hypothetical protein